MKCPKCGRRTPATLGSCKHCGRRLPRQKRGARPKPALPSWLSQRHLFIAWAIGLIILIALLIVIIPTNVARRQVTGLDREIRIERSTGSREIASNAVLGRVIAVELRANRRGQIAIRSLNTGKEYTFSVGWRTSYHPRRYPAIGEQVKVSYLADKGFMEATQVKIGE
jgi:hypothetical protein